nr:RNA-directed DNA polymerase, eukaryota [Tanacetum cinerariifolium]
MAFILLLIATILLKIYEMLLRGRCVVLSMVNKIEKLQFYMSMRLSKLLKENNYLILIFEWKQYGTLMRQTKNLMNINIDALYNILKQNQGDVNDALGCKKRAVVVTLDPLALVAKKTKVTKCKEKVVVQLESKGSDDDDISDLKKISALLAKAFNRKKFYAKPTNNNLRTSSASSSTNKKPEYVKFKEKKEDKRADNDDDQEIFHDANESASENFNENHIESQIEHDESEVDHNDSEEKDNLVDNYHKRID